MGTQIFEYASFAGGDYGRLENWRAPKDSFSAENMLVSRTGELCVRPGLRNISPTGLTAGAISSINSRGVGSAVFFSQGTALRYFTAGVGGAVSTAAGSFAATLGARVAVDDTTDTAYLATDNTTGLYSFNGTTLTQLANSSSCQAIALYGTRLAVVPRSATNTVVFSGDSAFTNWTISPDNAVSVTVGDSTEITQLIAQRNHLIIMKKNQVYVLTGTPGTSEAIRLLGRINGPSSASAAAKTFDLESIWYPDLLNNVPVSFDGTRAVPLDQIALPAPVSSTGVIALHGDDPNGVLFTTNADITLGTAARVWLRTNGRWTQHTFGVGVTNFVSTCLGAYAQDGDTDGDRYRNGSCLVFSDGGSALAAPTFWSWMPFMDRPGLEADPFSQSLERPGDASATPVSGSALLAEQRDRDGKEIQVRGVIVDFRSWNTGGNANNHFDLVVNTLNSYESSAPVSSATASFDEEPGQSDLAGSVRSKYFSFGDQGRGGAFNLQLSNVRGVAFQRFRIITETYPARLG